MARPGGAGFAPGAEVFPGGSVDRADRDPHWSELGGEGALDPRVERHLQVAAVRETFEECGVLIARDSNGRPCPADRVASLIGQRQRIHQGHPEEFHSELRSAGLRPGWEDLAYCAHWVTPKGLPRIFDTRFFLAALPPGQEALSDGLGELVSMRWARPAAALADAAQGLCLLLPPTRAVLELLAPQPSAGAALAAARTARVRRVRPRLDEITQARYPGLDLGAVLGSRRERS